MSSNYTIYTGHVWKEYGSNKLLLTLSGPAAGALQAAIPLFITLVGPLSWIFIQYPWFRKSTLRSSQSYPFQFFYRQKEIILRNSAGDLGTIKDSWGIFNAWRKYGFWSSFWRTGPLLLVASLFFCIWQAAGAVSFFIWQYTPPSVCLVRGSVCGYNFLEGPVAELPFRRIGLSQTIQAETYVTLCYGSSTSTACGVYANKALSYNPSDADCPFNSSSICISQNSTPYKLDSGLIDSHIDLGINAPAGNRVQYQKVTTCSPVHNTRFARIVNASDTDEAYYWPPDTKLQQFYYGPVQGANSSYTYEYSAWAPLDGFGYNIIGVMFNPGPAGTLNAWTPNSTFTSRTDADVSILFLTPNSISYNASVDDPWFLTDGNYTLNVNGEILTYYVPAFYVNTMGCIDQHRFCNPTKNLCTPFVAYLQIPDLLTTINYNPIQLATAERITTNLEMTATFNSVNNRGAAALLASQTVSSLLQTKLLPVDQWRLELENWFAVSLAKLQEGILEFAGGPSDPEIVPYVQFPVDPNTQALCYNQLVQLPPGYTNFDFDAIIIVTVLGFAILFLALGFETIAEKVITKWGRKRGLKEWREDGEFQLLKRMYENKGVAGWTGEDSDFPITKASLTPGVAQAVVVAPVATGTGSASQSGIPLLSVTSAGGSHGNSSAASRTP